MGPKIEKCLGFFDKISAFEETVLKIGIGSLKSYFVLQISIVCKIENLCLKIGMTWKKENVDSSAFIAEKFENIVFEAK